MSDIRTDGRLRWAIFTKSVVSAVNNPEALLWRSLATRLRHAGHQAIFYEPRGNESVRLLLRRDGSQGLKDFRTRFPDVEYRTFESRRGADLVEWMTRMLATVDVAMIPANADSDLVRWLGQLTRHHLQTFLLDSGWHGTASRTGEHAGNCTNYTAILVGDQRLVEEYARLEEAPRVFWFGPLPSVEQGVDDFLRPLNLAESCDRLIETVTRVCAENSLKTGGHNGAHRP